MNTMNSPLYKEICEARNIFQVRELTETGSYRLIDNRLAVSSCELLCYCHDTFAISRQGEHYVRATALLDKSGSIERLLKKEINMLSASEEIPLAKPSYVAVKHALSCVMYYLTEGEPRKGWAMVTAELGEKLKPIFDEARYAIG